MGESGGGGGGLVVQKFTPQGAPHQSHTPWSVYFAEGETLITETKHSLQVMDAALRRPTGEKHQETVMSSARGANWTKWLKIAGRSFESGSVGWVAANPLCKCASCSFVYVSDSFLACKRMPAGRT